MCWQGKFKLLQAEKLFSSSNQKVCRYVYRCVCGIVMTNLEKLNMSAHLREMSPPRLRP